VNFYAFLHRVVDEKIGRLLKALGDPNNPRSLRARTIITRISDHGEMGLSHGGLRQKMFNAYEETIRVPFVISNPLLFANGGECHAPVTLVDVLPTLLDLAGTRAEVTLHGSSLCGIVARHAAMDQDAVRASGLDLAAVFDATGVEKVRDQVLFTYDDHQAATAQQEAPGQPNRIRCVRDRRWKYALYLDPEGRASPEFELYDLDADPNEARNLVDKKTGSARTPSAARELSRLQEVLAEECTRTETSHPGLAARV
jgi:arylsulfatase A-like enzyme